MWDRHRLKKALKLGDPQGLHSEESVRASPSWFRSNPKNILAHRLYLWTVQNTQLLNCFQNSFNSSPFKGLSINSSLLKDLSINSFPLKGLSINSSPLKGLIVVWLYNPQFTTQCTQHLNTHIYLNHIHTQFITYTRSQSQWYNLNLTRYHTSWIIYTLPMNYAIHTTTQLFSKFF